MKFEFKVILFCIFIILLFVGCSKMTQSVSNVKSSSENSKIINKEKNDTNNNEESSENNQGDKKQDVESGKTKEVKGKIVVIDPGHGSRPNLEKEAICPGTEELKIKDGGGAEGINSKTPEYVITMDISMKLKSILESNGYNVIMTKTTLQESPGNIERAEVGNKNNADLVVRIHADSSENSNVSGASILVPAPIGYAKNISEISRKYGQVISENLVNEVGMKDRGVIERDDLTGFNWSKVPTILVEMGFLSNPQEDKLLNTQEYQNKIASGLFKGIDNVLNN